MPNTQEIKLVANLIKSLSITDISKLLSKNNFKLFNSAKDILSNSKDDSNLFANSPDSNVSLNSKKTDKELLNRYSSSKGVDAAYNALNLLGTAASTTGNVYGTKNELLGKALLLAAQGLESPQSTQVYGNPFAAIMALPSLAMQARGLVQKEIGSGINKAATDTANDMRAIDRRNKDISLMLNNDLPGDYFNRLTQAEKIARGTTR